MEFYYFQKVKELNHSFLWGNPKEFLSLIWDKREEKVYRLMDDFAHEISCNYFKIIKEGDFEKYIKILLKEFIYGVQDRLLENEELIEKYDSNEISKNDLNDYQKTIVDYNPIRQDFIAIIVSVCEEFSVDFSQLHFKLGLKLSPVEYEKDENDIIIKKERGGKKKTALTHKQFILLLYQLGVFDVPSIKQLTFSAKGKLFSTLLNLDEKNTTEYIRNVQALRLAVSMDKYFIQTESNLKTVEDFIKELRSNNESFTNDNNQKNSL
jgi:hypothetical protein